MTRVVLSVETEQCVATVHQNINLKYNGYNVFDGCYLQLHDNRLIYWKTMFDTFYNLHAGILCLVGLY